MPDSRYRATHIDVFNSGNTPLHETEYVFNDASEVESTMIDTVQTDYVYDGASQLEQESRPGYTCDYTNDDNGNRLSKVISGGIAETYSYDPEERLTSVTWNGGSNYKNFTYDDGGRITAINNTGSTRNFTYDEESRLVGISGAYTASYEYNGLRTRVEKTEALVTRTFMRDGAGPTSPVLNDGAAAYTPRTSGRRGGTTTYMHSGIKNADFQTDLSPKNCTNMKMTIEGFGEDDKEQV